MNYSALHLACLIVYSVSQFTFIPLHSILLYYIQFNSIRFNDHAMIINNKIRIPLYVRAVKSLVSARRTDRSALLSAVLSPLYRCRTHYCVCATNYSQGGRLGWVAYECKERKGMKTKEKKEKRWEEEKKGGKWRCKRQRAPTI